jgi:hypothetical protein
MLLTFSKPKFKDLIKNGTKKHTIRADKSDRWKVGNSIQFWNGNPRNTKAKNKPYQFGYGICCEIKKINILHSQNFSTLIIDDEEIETLWVDDCSFRVYSTEYECPVFYQLAKDDGFDSIEKFLEWFNADFEGKLIYWNECVWF